MPRARLNGIDTYFETSGQGFPVVAVHGHSLDRRMWREQVSSFSQRYRFVRYDMRGHGLSEEPGFYSWPAYAQDMDALRHQLGEERVAVIGLSMGGAIALEYALDYPERVAALALVDSALDGFSYSDAFIGFFRRLERLGRAGDREGLEREWLAHQLFDGARKDKRAWRLVRSMVARFSWAERLRKLPDPPPAPKMLDRIGEVKAPTLIVTGERDLDDFQLIARTMEANIRGSRRVVVPGCGHLTPLERAAAFNREALRFLRDALP